MALFDVVSSIARYMVQPAPKRVEQHRQYLVISSVFQGDFSGNHPMNGGIMLADTTSLPRHPDCQTLHAERVEGAYQWVWSTSRRGR